LLSNQSMAFTTWIYVQAVHCFLEVLNLLNFIQEDVGDFFGIQPRFDILIQSFVIQQSSKSIVLKWSDKRHLKVVLRYAFCCISTRWDAEGSENSENEKKTLCGQTPLVDTENAPKVKEMADFVRNQPFLLVRVGRFELPAS